MARTGRNELCPCGSGRKYKKCCLAKDEAVARSQSSTSGAGHHAGTFSSALAHDDVDNDSNRVIDLLDAGRLDEAEAAAHELLSKYPDVPDGLERLGMVHEKRGDHKQAAVYYRKAAAFMEGHEGFDPEVKAWLVDKADKLDPPAT